MNKAKIRELLNVETVIMETNIIEGVKEYAIKFKEIEICLKTIYSKQQIGLNKALENCIVSLICGTDHHYRYGEQFYLIPMDNKLEFRYTIKNGQTTKWNALAAQISKDDDYIISPYNTWSIKLKSGKLLKKYKDIEIVLELVRKGQFINNEESIELSHHYDLSSQMVQYAFNELLIIETVPDETDCNKCNKSMDMIKE